MNYLVRDLDSACPKMKIKDSSVLMKYASAMMEGGHKSLESLREGNNMQTRKKLRSFIDKALHRNQLANFLSNEAILRKDARGVMMPRIMIRPY